MRSCVHLSENSLVRGGARPVRSFVSDFFSFPSRHRCCHHCPRKHSGDAPVKKCGLRRRARACSTRTNTRHDSGTRKSSPGHHLVASSIMLPGPPTTQHPRGSRPGHSWGHYTYTAVSTCECFRGQNGDNIDATRRSRRLTPLEHVCGMAQRGTAQSHHAMPCAPLSITCISRRHTPHTRISL